jgi:hypothetical protein
MGIYLALFGFVMLWAYRGGQPTRWFWATLITLHPAKVGPPFRALDLHDQVVKADGIVLVHCALESLREDQD